MPDTPAPRASARELRRWAWISVRVWLAGLVLLVLMAALNVLLQDSLGRFGALMAAPTVLLLMAAAAMLVIGPVLAFTFSVIAYLRDEPPPSDSPWARRRRQLMPVLVSLPLLLPIGLYAVLAVLTLFGVFGES